MYLGCLSLEYLYFSLFLRYTVDLRWLEHGWCICFGCFRICVYLLWKNKVVYLGKIWGDIAVDLEKV